MKNYIFQTKELIMIQQIHIEAKQIKFMSKFIQFLVLLERKNEIRLIIILRVKQRLGMHVVFES